MDCHGKTATAQKQRQTTTENSKGKCHTTGTARQKRQKKDKDNAMENRKKDTEVNGVLFCSFTNSFYLFFSSEVCQLTSPKLIIFLRNSDERA